MSGSVPHQETSPLSHLTAPRGSIKCSLTFPSRSLAVTGRLVFICFVFKLGLISLTVERKKPRASKVSVSSSTCSKDDCYCPANQLCTCATSIPIPPVKRASPQLNPWSSSSTAAVVSATPPTKPPSTILACPQKQRQDSWKAFDPFDDPLIGPPGPSSLGLTSESSREIFQELLGESFSRELEEPAEAEIFLSDDEGEEDVGDLEPPSASGSSEEVEQSRLQEEPDGMITHLEDLLREKNALEREKEKLWAEKMKQEGELFQEKACNDLLKQKVEALEVQHRSEKELLEKVLEEAKACIKVLRERMESLQEQLKQKEIKEKKLEETLCEEKERQAKMEREREQLEGEVSRLTEALMTSSTDDRGGVNSRRMLRATQSAPGGLAGNTFPGEESSRWLFGFTDRQNEGWILITTLTTQIGETAALVGVFHLHLSQLRIENCL